MGGTAGVYPPSSKNILRTGPPADDSSLPYSNWTSESIREKSPSH